MGRPHVYEAAAVIHLGSFCLGTVLSYSGSAIPDMERDSSPIQHFMNNSSARSWFSSIICLGALTGALISGPIANTWGRRPASILASIPLIVGFVMMFFARSYEVILLGRWFTGVSAGMACTNQPVFAVEIAPPRFRGAFGTMFALFATTGVAMTSFLTIFAHWEVTSLVWASVPAVWCLGTIFFTTESPRWLVSRGRTEEAKKSVKYLYGDAVNAGLEVAALAKQISEEKHGSVQWSEYLAKSVWKPAVVSSILIIFQQSSGFGIFLVYSVSIFISAGAFSVPPIWCAIIIQMTQVFSTLLLSIVVDRLGRRPMLLWSSTGTTISTTVLGVYSYLNRYNPESVESFRWLPLVCLFLFMMTFESGYGPLPWLILPELVPVRVRGTISGIATALCWFGMFLTTITFESGIAYLGDYGIYWFYAGVNFCAIVFAYFCVPESLGKTIDQVQRYYENGQVWEDEYIVKSVRTV